MTRILTSSSDNVVNLNTAGEVSLDDVEALDVLYTDKEAQVISGGARIVPFSIGTITGGTFIPDPGNCSLQYLTNNAPLGFNIQTPIYDGSCCIAINNGAAAGNISFIGFNTGINTGDDYVTTPGYVFFLSIIRINGRATYSWKATQ